MKGSRSWHLVKGRVLDPGSSIDLEGDVVVVDGRISEVGRGLSTPPGARRVDCRHRLVVPGLIDMHSHLREPGEEYKEDIASGSAAALAGGFTAVCAMPNTRPPNDCRPVTELIVNRAREVDGVRVYPIGAITKGLGGETLADMAEMKEAGAVAVSDDGKCVMNAALMRRALEYARTFGLTVIQHAEDQNLSQGGSMNEGVMSTRAGLRAQPAQAEQVIIARDLELVALTGARYHVAHISTAESVRMIRTAKLRGLPVSCEVTPHHLTLTDEACLGYDTSTKVNPPLRTPRDVEALRQGVAEGTIDAIATDHAPHASVNKDLEYELASFGMIGLETALALTLGLVERHVLTLETAIYRLTAGPARLLNLPGGTLARDAPADITIIDPSHAWTVGPESLCSKSRNTPFAGQTLKGRATLTMVGGKVGWGEDAR